MGEVCRIHCPFVGSDSCTNGWHGQGLKIGYILKHITDVHFNSFEGEVRYKTILASDYGSFCALENTLRLVGAWLCGKCLSFHALSKACKSVNHPGICLDPPKVFDDGSLDVCIQSISKPTLPCFQLENIGAVTEEHSFSLNTSLLDAVFKRSFTTVKHIPNKCRIGVAKALREAMGNVISQPKDISAWIKMLLLPCCILRTVKVVTRRERRSGYRKHSQIEAINARLSKWSEHSGVLDLVSEMLDSNRGSRIDRDISSKASKIKLCKRKLSDGHYTAAIKVLTSGGIAPVGENTLSELREKHPLVAPPTLPTVGISESALVVDKEQVFEGIKGFPKGTSCGRDGLRAQHLVDCLSGAASVLADEVLCGMVQICNLLLSGACSAALGEFLASAPLTPLIKPGGGIRPIAVGTIWRRLVSKLAAKAVAGVVAPYFAGYQFGVGVAGGCEAILHSVNRLLEGKGEDSSITMLLVDFRNAFNLVDRNVLLMEVRKKCSSISPWVEFCYTQPGRLYYGEEHLWSCLGVQQGDPLGPLLFALVLHPLILSIARQCKLSLQAWYLDDGTIVGDTMEVSKALKIISEEGPKYGLHLNIDKTEIFWPTQDTRSTMDGVFPLGIARPTKIVKLLGGAVSLDGGFKEALAIKRADKAIELMEAIRCLHDPQSELMLLRACGGVAKLFYGLRTSDPAVFQQAQKKFDTALRVSLNKIITNEGAGYGAWQHRLATLPIRKGGLGILTAQDTLVYAFVASRLQTEVLQSMILKDSGLEVSSKGMLFDKALQGFMKVCKLEDSDFDLNAAVPKIMKRMAVLYYDVMAESLAEEFNLSDRSRGLWDCLQEDKAQEFLYAIPIEGLGNTMDGRQYRSVLCYRLGIPLFSNFPTCPCCSKKIMDPFGDHAIACAQGVGYKFRHNLVRDVMCDVFTQAGISIQKEAQLGFLSSDERVGLRPADILVYSWDSGKNVCVDVTGVSPFVGLGKSGFCATNSMERAALKKHRKHGEVCLANGYGFVPFAFSALGGIDKEGVELIRRVVQVVRGHCLGVDFSCYFWPRISFSIQKGVGAQLVARLPINFVD